MGQPISNETAITEGSLASTNHGTFDDMIYSLPTESSLATNSNNNSIEPPHPSSSSPTTTNTTSSNTQPTNSILNETEKALKRKSANFTEAISMMHHSSTTTTNPASSSSLTILSSSGGMYNHNRSSSNTSQESPTSNSLLNANSPPTLSAQHSHKHLSIDSRLFALLNNKSNSDSNNRSSRSFQPRPFSISSLDGLGFDGINKVLKDKMLLSQFRSYTKMEYSEENLDIFLVSNQLLEECKKSLDNVIIDGGIGGDNSQTSKRNSSRLGVQMSRSKLLKSAQSQFAFEEKIIKKLEKSLEQVIEKMQKMNLEKRKSLVKGRRKNTEFLGIDRNMFKQAFASGNGSGDNLSSIDEDLFASSFTSFSFSGATSSSSIGLEEINVGRKLKSQIEKIKENNQIQQQWLTNKRSSKRMSMKFFSSSSSSASAAASVLITNANSSTSLNITNQGNSSSTAPNMSQSHPSNLEGNQQLWEDQDFEEIPQIKIVQFLEDLRFECLMNLKDTFIRFCHQNKLSVR